MFANLARCAQFMLAFFVVSVVMEYLGTSGDLCMHVWMDTGVCLLSELWVGVALATFACHVMITNARCNSTQTHCQRGRGATPRW